MDASSYQPPPERLQPVLLSLGFALWQTQSLENTLVHYLVMVHKVPIGTAREQVEQVFAATSKHTLGRLLHDLTGFEGESTDFVDRLGVFLPERNWLVHRSRHTSHTDLFSAELTQALLERLARVASDALALMQDIQTALESALVEVGVTREFIDRKSAEILQEWANAESSESAS